MYKKHLNINCTELLKEVCSNRINTCYVVDQNALNATAKEIGVKIRCDIEHYVFMSVPHNGSEWTSFTVFKIGKLDRVKDTEWKYYPTFAHEKYIVETSTGKLLHREIHGLVRGDGYEVDHLGDCYNNCEEETECVSSDEHKERGKKRQYNGVKTISTLDEFIEFFKTLDR